MLLDRAEQQAEGLDPSLHRKLKTVRSWVAAKDPAELVQVLQRDLVPIVDALWRDQERFQD